MAFPTSAQLDTASPAYETQETTVRPASQDIVSSLFPAPQASAQTHMATVPVVDVTNMMPQAPSPVVITQHRHRSAAAEFDARFDDFFGTPRRNHNPAMSGSIEEGRQHRPSENRSASSAATSRSHSTSPPPYGTPDYPAPAYEVTQEPLTLSKYLFKYGFMFPPFWFIGALILCMRLPPIPEVECGKTAEEQAEELAILRRAEVRWSKYCAVALVVLLMVMAALFLGLYFGGVLKSL